MLDDVASVTLQTALSGLSLRQQVTANNIANLETPGYLAQNVSFESSLADAVNAGNPAAAQITESVTPDAAGQNGNNVSLDDQVVTATKTGLQEQLLSNAITNQYGLLSTVLKGGA